MPMAHNPKMESKGESQPTLVCYRFPPPAPPPTSGPRLIALVYFSRRVLAVCVCISQTAAEVQTALHWRRTSWKSTCSLWLLTNFYPILPFYPSHTTEAAFSQGLETTLVPSCVLPPLSDQVPPGPTVQPLPYLLLQSLLFVPLTLPSLGLICHLAKPLQWPPGCPLMRSGVDISSCPWLLILYSIANTNARKWALGFERLIKVIVGKEPWPGQPEARVEPRPCSFWLGMNFST